MFHNVSEKVHRALIVVVALWISFVVVIGFFGDDESVREQTEPTEGRDGVRNAISTGIEALAGQPFPYAVVPVTGQACDITPIRTGVLYEQHVDFFAETAESDLILNQLSEHFEPRYDLSPIPAEGSQGTTEEFIDLTLTRNSTVRWHADTGCRGAEGHPRVEHALDHRETKKHVEPIVEPVGEISFMSHVATQCPDGAAEEFTYTYWAELEDVDAQEALADFREYRAESVTVLVDTEASFAYQTRTGDFVIAQEGQVLSEEEDGASLAYTTPCGPVS